MGKDKLRVFSFTASCAGDRSHTKKVSDMLADVLIQKAAKRGIEVSYECMTGDQLRVDYCRSCISCFNKGICPLDDADDMAMLKQKFLDADIIFFCTPIYLWEMSGLMKTVLDRISSWIHIFKLAGKTGMAVISTDSSMGPDFEERFSDLIRFTGISMAGSITSRKFGAPGLHTKDVFLPLLEEAADKILACCDDPSAFVTKKQDIAWRTFMIDSRRMQILSDIAGTEMPYEAKVRMELGMTEYGSLQDYLKGQTYP